MCLLGVCVCGLPFCLSCLWLLELFYHAEPEDYNTTACSTAAQLRQSDPIQVNIDFPRDNSVALEGTERLEMQLQFSPEQRSIITAAGNIFIRSESNILIQDITSM